MPGSVSEIAADYVRAIREVQPQGPYLLGGFCVGGAIAAEIAEQLRELGEVSSHLFLLDPRFRRPSGVRYTLWLVGRRARQRRLARAVWARITRRTDLGAQPVAGEARVQPEIHPALADLRESHRPRPTDAPATVILSTGFEDYELPSWYLRGVIRRPRRWRRLEVPHGRLLLPPVVDVVAREVRAALDEALPQETRT